MQRTILIAGFQHETNTFAPSKTDWPAFMSGESNPAYLRGQEMLDVHRQLKLPAGGFLSAAADNGWQVIGSAWAGAIPAAHITRDAFERIADAIVSDAKTAMANKLDGIYLDLHGAAVAEHVPDAEGEILRRLRNVVGPGLPIVASLDMHANVSIEMLELADALVGYRTYPHIDQVETGRRAADLMQRRLTLGYRAFTYWKRLDFLLPLNVQSTLMEPCNTIFHKLANVEREYQVMATFSTGFPAADVACCGPVVWAHGTMAKDAVDQLFALVDSPRAQWKLDLHSPDQASQKSIELAKLAARPIVIADTQDNPGAGGDTNTTGMLHALLRAKAGQHFPGQVAMGLMFDIDAAARAHEAGVGQCIALSLGRSVKTYNGEFSDSPVVGSFTVRALGDGHILAKGPMSKNRYQELGLCACLEIEGILIVVVSGKAQMIDRELYRHVGIHPEAMKILVNKSSVHFRADFAPIADHILVAKAKGPVSADPGDLLWTNLRPEMQLRP